MLSSYLDREPEKYGGVDGKEGARVFPVRRHRDVSISLFSSLFSYLSLSLSYCETHRAQYQKGPPALQDHTYYRYEDENACMQ